jgi:hypothetical protein
MNWNNASLDEPPQDGQDVIICVDGIYHLAVYQAESGTYKLSADQGTVVDPRESLIYWMQNYRGLAL